MVKFVANKIAVNNSDLWELRDYDPVSGLNLTVSISSSYKNGKLTVKVFEDLFQSSLKYKIVDEVSKKKAATLFKGDFEQKLFDGNDEIKGSTDSDMLYGFAGKDVIEARAGADTVYGGSGNDTLYGGTGANTLYGGGGKDAFVFDAGLTPGNNSHVADFKSGKDTLQLAKSVFSGIGEKGALKGAKFFEASEYAGQKKAVIYDKDTGALAYAKNGGDAVEFGSVTAGLDLSHKDFLIV